MEDSKLACDNKGALFTLKKIAKRIPTVSSSADVCRALRELNRRLGDQSTAMYMLECARGCQDRSKKFRNLWLEARPKVERTTMEKG